MRGLHGLVIVWAVLLVTLVGGYFFIEKAINDLTRQSLVSIAYSDMIDSLPLKGVTPAVEPENSSQAINEPNDIQPAGGYRFEQPTEQVQVGETTQNAPDDTIAPMTRQQWLEAHRPGTDSTSQQTTIEFAAQ